MSTLTKVLEKNVAEIEKNADMTEGRFRLGHHLMPPMGWLNDPNGYAGIRADIMCSFSTHLLMWRAV